ncbi:MAG: Methionyl-tRNA formyltransferase [Fimbriimonadaceae bacterium]|nr:Methionyl-tRNA formyltransferase [Fimbriimonadaceae bacterium]
MKLAFFGSSEFAIPTLRALAGSIDLVVTQPDKPFGRKMQLQSTPVKETALELGLEVVEPARARDPEFVDSIAARRFDALVVAAYGQILPQRLLESAMRGGINLHGSILPSYRGAAPIQRAIMNGDTETGVTLMQMDRGMDTGDIIAIRTLAIGANDTASALLDTLGSLAAEMAMEWMPRIVDGNYPRAHQDHDRATYAPKIERSDCILDWTASCEDNYNRFRGVTEHPGALLPTKFGNLKLRRAAPGAPGGVTGSVYSLRPFTVAMAGGGLELQVVQPEGKGPMSGSDWANGMRLKVGMSVLPS